MGWLFQQLLPFLQKILYRILDKNFGEGLAFPISAGIMRACFIDALLGQGLETNRSVPFV